MKLTEKSNAVYEYLVNNGGRASIDELAEQLGVSARSVGANVTDLSRKGLVVREKVAGEGEDAKDITFTVLTADYAEVYAALPERK